MGKIDEILLNLTAPMRLLAEEVKGTITLLQKLQEKRSAAAAKGKVYILKLLFNRIQLLQLEIAEMHNKS